MASIDLDKMLAKIKSTQWALSDIDWDAPGAELITEEQWPKLKDFMADLMWIEHIGARAFAAMAKKAPTDTLREIYTYFHAEEQRHANAEMALMKRWGKLEGEEIPEPNINLRLVIEWLDRYSDEMPVYVLGTVVPMLEIALDGALCTFLLETVKDPVCHQAFEKINDDESRHLGVGFSVMEMQGRGKTFIGAAKMLAPLLDQPDAGLCCRCAIAEQDARQHHHHGTAGRAAVCRHGQVRKNWWAYGRRPPQPLVPGDSPACQIRGGSQ